MDTKRAATAVEQLLLYGVDRGLIEEIDTIYVRNLLMDALRLVEPDDAFDKEKHVVPATVTPIMQEILDYAVGANIIGDTTTERDLFDTRLMGLLTPLPSTILKKYEAIKAKKGVKAATDYFYDLNQATDYIRVDRIKKNVKWEYNDEDYGNLEITINLSKPEKDPQEIAKLKNMPKMGYPACMLCAENMGYAGRLNHPARQSHRLLPVTLNEEQWYMQYSPYVYYNEHCIVLKGEHVPMFICRDTFMRLLQFVDTFPHYFLGSNAGLPVVGGSILNHDHYQGGGYEMPMAKAPIYREFTFKDFPNVKAGAVKWPMTCLRLSCDSLETIADAATHVLNAWESYSDEALGIHAETNGEPHNAITPIARKRGDNFEIDLVLRNNETSQEYPLGIYHPHPELHHIKKENIGLIEVMGLFILPGRLKDELKGIHDILTGRVDFDADELNNPAHPLHKHLPWIMHLVEEHGLICKDHAIDKLLQDDVGNICRRVLEDAGVFKDTEEGREGFASFLRSCNME